jgi:nucleoside-diphosphate-sugar epimerase
MSPNPTILIAGATGFIGSALAKHFAAKGWNVIGTSRNIPDRPVPGVHYERFDLQKPTVREGVFRGVDVFIHAAFVAAKQGGDTVRSNTEGTQQLLAAARRSGVKKCVFLSSLAAHEDALSDYGRQKRAIEKVFSEATDLIVRPGLVLGDGGLFGRMKTQLQRSRTIPVFGDGRQPVQTIYLDDLVLFIDRLLDKNSRGTFTACEPAPVSYREFYIALAAIVGVTPKFIRLPYSVVLAGIAAAKLVGKDLPIDRDNVLGLRSMKVWDSAGDIERAGVPVRSWRESVATLKQLSGQ